MNIEYWHIWSLAILIFIVRGKAITRGITQAYKEKIKRLQEKNDVLLQLQKSNPTRILYLRDFEADGIEYKTEEFYNNKYVIIKTNFETKLSFKIGWLGYFVAVGRKKGDIGADRYTIENNIWKEEVCKLMDSSSIIIFRPSLSVGVMWEFEQLVKNDHRKKVIICYNKKEDGLNEYKLFRDISNKMIKLPSTFFATKYMCIDEDNTVHKYYRLQSTPIYKQIFLKEKGRIEQLKVSIKNEAKYKMAIEKERAQKIDTILIIALFLSIIFLYFILVWQDSL
jgi:hypothetical protein